MLVDQNDTRSHFSSLDMTSDDHTTAFHAEVGPHKRLSPWVLLPSLIVFLFCLALPSVMIWYLLSRPAISPATEDMHLFNGAIIVVEGSQKSSSDSSSGQTEVSTLYGLAFATIISHIIMITVPLLMGLLAYCIAAKWLDFQTNGNNDIKQPMLTPIQYGVMLKIYGSSNLFTFFQSGQYLYRQNWTEMTKSPVVSSFLALAFVLFLSHAIGFVDLWLHTVSGTVIYSSISHIDDLASMPYGTTINMSICPYPGYQQQSFPFVDPPASEPGGIPPGQNCASYTNNFVQSLPPGPGWGDILNPSILAASVSAFSNVSNFRTTTIIESDNMAVLIPPSVSSPSFYNFTASTYGVSMSCQVPKCQLYQSGPTQGVDGGPFGCTNFNPVYNASLYDLTSFLYNPMNMSQQPDWSNGTGSNPFGFFIELPFDNVATGLVTSGTNGSQYTNGEPGWYYGTYPGSVIYLTQCTVTSYDVILSNFNNTYSVVNKSLTDFNTTSALSSGFIEWMASTYLLPQIKSIMVSETKSPNFLSMLQTQLMLRSLALNAGILQEMPVNSSTASTPSIASRYPTVPVATFLALLYAYGIVALISFAWTCFFATDSVIMYSSKKKNTCSMLQMVQVRLTDPLAAVAEGFANTAHAGSNSQLELRDVDEKGFLECKRTLETDALNMFDPDDRRSIAPQISRAANGNIWFSLRKRCGTLSMDDMDVEYWQ